MSGETSGNNGCKIKQSVGDRAQSSVSSTNSDEAQTGNMDVSTPSCLDMTSVDIGEIVETNNDELLSTSAVLFYCKSKILYPYLKFLSFMGLRPVSLDQLQTSKIVLLLWHYHTIQITVLILLGYALQYLSCFRRDRGFCYEIDNSHYIEYEYEDYGTENPHNLICYNNTIFSFIIPNILHFCGYVYAIYLFRISDNEQLQHLMERVFLLSSFPPQGTPYTSPKKLLLTLWFYIFLSIIWTALSLVTVSLMLTNGTIVYYWITPRGKLVLFYKILLAITTLTHDMVQATIITSYCLQAQLLTEHLHFLRNRLLTRTISLLDWMREVAEFRKLLRHLNEVLAPVICVFTIVNISWAVSGTLWLLNVDKVDKVPKPVFGFSILNEFLWISASIVPFILAARLTTACSVTQAVGHEIIVRPFLHQDTPQEDLNTVLLYASSLQMSARLFRLPITGRYLCLVLTLTGIILFALSMCHYLPI